MRLTVDHLRLGILILAATMLFSRTAGAIEGIVLKPGGEPAASCQVSIVGRSGSVRTDARGRFMISPDPIAPFTAIVTGAGGEVYPPIRVESFDRTKRVELSLQPAYQESVTVVSGVAPNLSATPAAATKVIGHEELEIRSPQHLVEALEGTAGISRLEEGASGVPVIRGMARGRTLILIDDARVSAERRAGPSATFLDPFTLGSIEVARGPGSVAYGSDAFGGVIHARPREPVPGQPFHLRYQISAAGGASDIASGGVEATSDVFGAAILGQLHLRRSGDDEEPGGRTITNSSFRDGGASLRFLRHFGTGQLKLGLAFDRGEEIGKPAPDSAAVRAYYPTERSLRLTGGYDFAPRGKWSAVELRALAGEYRLVLDRDRRASSSAPRRIERSDVDAKDASLRLTGYRPLGRGRMHAGVDIISRFDLRALTERIDFETTGRESARSTDASVEEARRIDAALFASHELELRPAWRISAGVRGDRVIARNRGGHFGGHSANHFAPSGFAAVTGGPWSDLTATIQGGIGFRDPTLSDRYFRGPSGRGFVTGNPELDPERSRQLDLALQWRRNDTFVALYAYNYTIEDLIERYRIESDFFFRNRGEAVIRGIELEGHTPLTRGFSVEWTAARSQGEGSGGSAIDDVAPPNASTAFRWSGPGGFLSLRAARSWSHDDPGPTETKRDGYSTFEVSAGYRLSKAVEFRMIARNVTNEIYFGSADPQAVITPGRSILFTLSGLLSP